MECGKMTGHFLIDTTCLRGETYAINESLKVCLIRNQSPLMEERTYNDIAMP